MDQTAIPPEPPEGSDPPATTGDPHLGVKEAIEDIGLVEGVMGAGPPTPPPPKPFFKSPGCMAIPVVLTAIILIIWALTSGDSDTDGSNVMSKPPPSELMYDEEETTTTETPTTSVGDDETQTTTAGGGGAAWEPPSEDDLPAGEVLYQGESGGNIGHIAMDGQSRFLSITAPGVGVGNESIGAQATPWPSTGKVTGFGVKLGTSSSAGRYGFNLFLNGTTYSVGCSMEVGQTSCVATPANLEGTPKIEEGALTTIIIGEEGHVEEKGEFPVSWWFTYKPN